eukprot:TRINITY_DN3391_c0_g2_i1.p1 TRINITY_DN3391_c0_g2~~TRINITY_DN3391_c0_g2_i1.p1  ORF type:complete len:202 (+),score=52.77 TRINITY_DN3391_c0_g2_i1:2-607(+)
MNTLGTKEALFSRGHTTKPRSPATPNAATAARTTGPATATHQPHGSSRPTATTAATTATAATTNAAPPPRLPTSAVPPTATTQSFDPSTKAKVEQARRLQNLVIDLGRTTSQLLDGSDTHETIFDAAKQFSKHESSIVKSEKMVLQMQGQVAELSALIDHIQASAARIRNVGAVLEDMPFEKDEYKRQRQVRSGSIVPIKF